MLAGHRLSLEPGGAKTRGFRRGEKTKQRTKEKKKEKKKKLEGLGAGGANVRENTAKTRCFESEKNERTENEEKNKKQLPGATPSNEGVRKHRGETSAKTLLKRGVLKLKKTPETQPPFEQLQHKK